MNLANASAVHLGGEDVDAIYLGANEVWSGAAPEVFPGYTSLGAYSLDLAATDPNFTLTNVERGMDPLDSQPAALLTTVGAFGTIKTVAAHENVILKFKFRPVARGVFDITNLYMAPILRYADDANEWRVQRGWGDGNSYFQALSHTASADSVAVLAGGMNNSDDVTHRWMEVQIFEDEIIRAREWADGDAIPDWASGPRRLRGTAGFTSTGTADVDNSLTGLAGIRFIYGFYIKELTVEPLARTHFSVLNNRDLEWLKNSNEPYFYDRSASINDATNGLTIEDKEWSDSVTRPTFVVKSDSNGEGPLWEQPFYLDTAADNIYFTRDHPRPAIRTATFPDSVRIKGFTQGTNVHNASGAAQANQLTAHFVMYYYSADGDLLMNTEGHLDDYHFALGPINNGQGTWDRWEFDHEMPINSNEDVVYARPSWGLHDPTAQADELLIEITELVAA